MIRHSHLLGAILTGGLCLSSSSLLAQSPVSKSTGIIKTDIPANTTTLVGLPFVYDIVDRESIVSATSNVVTVKTNGFTVDDLGVTALNLTASPHSVVLLTGERRGTYWPVSASTNNTVTITGNIGTVSAADQIEIVADWTMAKLFGPTNSQNFTAATAAGSADRIQAMSNGTVRTFFYNPGIPSVIAAGWREVSSGGADASNFRIDGFSGLQISRRPGSTLTFHHNGLVRTGNFRIALGAGAKIITTWPFLRTSTLNASNIQNFLTPNTSAGSADRLQFSSGGTIKTFYYNPGIPSVISPGWREVSSGGSDQGTTNIPVGGAILVTNVGAAAAISMEEPFLP